MADSTSASGTINPPGGTPAGGGNPPTGKPTPQKNPPPLQGGNPPRGGPGVNTGGPGVYTPPPSPLQGMINSLSGSNRDAFVALETLFTQYGLGSLVNNIFNFIKQGYSQDTITLLLQDTPEYKQRFAGNAIRQKNGLAILSPADYLATEASYYQVVKAAGLPANFYNSTSDWVNWIGNDVSPGSGSGPWSDGCAEAVPRGLLLGRHQGPAYPTAAVQCCADWRFRSAEQPGHGSHPGQDVRQHGHHSGPGQLRLSADRPDLADTGRAGPCLQPELHPADGREQPAARPGPSCSPDSAVGVQGASRVQR